MYSPGDIVVGYPDYYESDGKRFICGGYDRISGTKNKWTLILDKLLSGVNVPWPATILNSTTGVEESTGEKTPLKSMSYKNVKGMVVAVDELDTERPHWDGIVSVLVDEEILWFWARNLRMAKFGKGYTPK